MSSTRLFNPLLDNPLHGGNGGSESSSEGSRILVDNVSPQQTSKSIRSPDASPNNHHVRWSDPLCQVKTFKTQTQTTINTNNVTIADKNSKFVLTGHVTLIVQVEKPEVVPVIPVVPGLLQAVPSLSTSELEGITRLNLRPLMLSKGIIISPTAVVQAVPQTHQLMPPQPLYTQQLPLSFDSFCNTFPAPTFLNSQITIQAAQAAQPPVLQNIGLNNRSRDLEHTPPEGECALNSGQSGAAPVSENHTDTENMGSISVPQIQSASKQLHKQVGHAPHPFANFQKKILTRGTRFSPYDKGKQRQKAGSKTCARLDVIRWKNAFVRLWYLLDHGGYSNKEHDNLMTLLSEMNKKKSHVTLEWLKETKVAEYLEKFKKEESIFDYEPLVREMADSILQFWNKEFQIPLS